MSYLLPFLFNTVRKRTIDPSSTKFFLPVVLTNADGSNSHGKLLPVEEKVWQIGNVTGEGGSTVTTAFINQWAIYLQKVQKVDLSNQYPIADPSTPYPELTLGGNQMVVISGLENIFVAPNPRFTAIPEGYKIESTLQIGYWDGTDGKPKYPQLTINGGYELKQKLAVANKQTGVINPQYQSDIDGTGTVNLLVTNAFLDTVVHVTVGQGPGGNRQLAVQVVSLKFRGPSDSAPPELGVQSLSIDASVSEYLRTVWKTMATRAIQSPDGTNGIFRNINLSLNEPGNLGPLSNELTSKLATAMDGLMGGPVTDVLAPIQPSSTINPVDRYLFDRVRYSLNSQSSTLFLPQLLCQNQSPSLCPLNIDRIDLPPINILGIEFSNAALTNVVFTGLSNVKAPPESIHISNAEVLDFTGILGGWNPPPKVSCSNGIPAPPATGTAKFTLTPPGSDPLTGNISLVVKTVQVISNCVATGPDDSTLDLDIQCLQLASANPASDIQINLDIDSDFKEMINSILSQPNILQKILDGINEQLNKMLPDISREVTRYARSAIQSGLR